MPGLHRRYVEYSPGNTNLIFTVPHDGQIRPKSIPTRKNVRFFVFVDNLFIFLPQGCRDVVGGVCFYPSKEGCQKPFLCKVCPL